MTRFFWLFVLAYVCKSNTQPVLQLNEGQLEGSTVGTFPCPTNGTFDFSNSNIYPNLFKLSSNTSSGYVQIKLNQSMDIDKWLNASAANGCNKKINLSGSHFTGKCPGKVPASMPIYLKTTNDYAPYFCDENCTEISTLTLNLPENTTEGTVLRPFKICDKDTKNENENDQNRITVPPGYFRETNMTQIRLISQLDYDNSTRIINIMINASDERTDRPNHNLTLTINVTDVDDQGINFTANTYNCKVFENVVNANICQVKALDLDTYLNTPVHYEVVSGYPAIAPFVINASTGLISNVQPLDRENENERSYVFLIKGYQVDRPADRINYTTAIITILDQDDNPPVLQPSYNATVLENSPIGTIICQVIASDRDEPINTLHYGMISSTDLFAIKHNGEIIVNNTIDREALKASCIELKVFAYTQNSTEQSNYSIVRIEVHDDNDNSPVFQNHNSTSINKTVFGPVFQANATDRDQGNNGVVRYTLETSDVPFRINNNTGNIIVFRSMNESFKESYELLVCAEDQAVVPTDRRKSCMIITIDVQDVNIHLPIFDPTLQKELNVSENVDVHSILLNLKANDQDPTDNITFTLVDSSGAFKIHNNSFLVTNTTLDRELVDSYHISVQISNEKTYYGNCSSTNNSINITIHVLDDNDNSPVFHNNNSIQIQKTLPVGSTVLQVNATDRDQGNNGVVRYMLETSDVPFRINNNTGNITVFRSMNKSFKESYELLVCAEDQAVVSTDRRTTCTVLDIHVKDMNIHSPVFDTSLPTNVSILENAKIGEMLLELKASDLDPTDNLIFTLMPQTEMFSISNNRFLVTRSKLDREKVNQFVIGIQVSDGNNSNSHSTNFTLTVDVMDENDNSPIFHNVNSTWINKTQRVHTSVFTLDAKDEDLDNNGIVEYRLETKDSPFVVNKSSGDIVLEYPINKTFKNMYQLFLCAEDQSDVEKDRRTTCTVLDIHVKDMNIHSPVFDTSLPTNVSILENAKIGEMLLELKASDLDPTDNLAFTLMSHTDVFNIFNNRFLVTNSKLDREHQDHYVIVIQVSDGNNVVNKNISITVTDANDNEPVFTNISYKFSIQEGTPPQIIGCVNATDRDTGENSRLTYIMDTLSQWKDNFTINNVTGCLSTLGAIDREELQSSVYFYIFVSDHGIPRQIGKTEVHISVIDINDNCPIFLQQHVTLSINELTPADKLTDIFTAKASDADLLENGTVAYFLDTGNKSVINVHKTTGVVSLLVPPVIHNCTDPTVIFTIRANNTSPCTGQNKMNTLTVTIQIQDVNNHIPKFIKPLMTQLTVPGHSVKDQPQNIRERYPVTDDDCKEEFKEVYYWINCTDPRLDINMTTGELYLKSPLIHHEPYCDRKLEFTIYISNLAYSLTGTHPAASSKPIVISVQQESPGIMPKFDKDHYQCEVQENRTGEFGCLVHLITCSDTTVQYSVNDTKTFSITVNGSLSITKSLNYENQSERIVYVNVTGSRENASTSVTVTIIVTNINDMSPEFTNATYNFSILEDSMREASIGAVLAIDGDGMLNNLAYSLVSGHEYFSLSGNILKAARIYDFDNKTGVNPMQGVISVTDTLHSNNVTVTVHVLPVNEYTPNFFYYQPRAVGLKSHVSNLSGETKYQWNIQENNIAQLNWTANDEDFGKDGEITYKAIIPDMFKLNITPYSSSESLVLNVQGFDRDILGDTTGDFIITLTVLACDGGTPQKTGIATIDIAVGGLNDNVPNFLKTDRNITIYLDEGSKYEWIYQSMALDNDLPIGAMSWVYYCLLPGNDAFRINATTGILSSDQLYISTDNKGRYNLCVNASNKPGNCNNAQQIGSSSFQTITIVLKDINNNGPVFNQAIYNQSVNECNLTSHAILRIHATDSDTTAEFNHVTYWIDSDEERFFHVDSETGDVYAINNIDLKSQANTTFEIKIYATDLLPSNTTFTAGGKHTVFTNVSITIVDCNNHSPTFTKELFVCNVAELTIGNLNCHVDANDVDYVSKNSLIYEIVTKDYNTSFSINHTTGVIRTINILDYESVSTVILNVSVNDGYFKSYASVLINVENIDDNAPKFTKPVYEFNVWENINIMKDRYIIGSVEVKDADSSFNLSMKCDNCSGCFEMENNGNIWPKKSFDFETGITVFNCIAFASDSQNKTNATIKISVVDENDNAPIFEANMYEVTVNETEKPKSYIRKVKANDKDGTTNNSIVSYEIISGNVNSAFYLNSISGDLCTNKTIANGIHVYTLLIKAKDNGQPQLFGFTLVIIKIYHCPKFLDPPYYAEVRENRLMQITKILTSGSDNKTLSLKNKTTYFFLNDSTLYANFTDAELQGGQNCTLRIEVSDGICKAVTDMTVAIIDENEFKPYFNNTLNLNFVRLNDTTSIGETVTTFTANDYDVSNHGFTYILHNSTCDFNIDEDTGRLTVANRFGQHGKTYDMSIKVLDSGEIPKSSIMNFTVHIIDTNNYTPKFENETISVFWSENNMNCSQLLIATDKDLHDAGNVTYTILADNNSDIFKTFKLNSLTGLLELKQTGKLDFEHVQNYSFHIQATDHGIFPRSATAKVVVNVVDINEKPEICMTPSEIYLQLNSTVGTFVSKAVVTDSDTKEIFKKYSYQLSDSERFKIDNNGTIYLNMPMLQSANITLMVTVTDGGYLKASANLSVIVPNVEIVYKQHTISEDYLGALPIDLHRNKTGKVIKFKILPSVYAGMFQVLDNGTILITDKLDREVTSSVNITIQTYDEHGILSAEFKVMLHITDENDCSPIFPSNYTITVEDDAEPDSPVSTIAAVDLDVDPVNRNLSYSLNGTSSSAFYVNNITGELFIKNLLLYNTSTYKLQVLASDGKNLGKAFVYITVADTNDHSPKFKFDNYSFVVKEGIAPQSVGIVDATDLDTGRNGNISYFITGSRFSIKKLPNNSGMIETAIALDRELSPVYTVIVIAKDNAKDNNRQGICTVTIQVADENDNWPSFTHSSYNGSISEQGSHTVEIIPPIKATDPDLGSYGTAGIMYYLAGEHAPFCIDGTTAVISLCGMLDREKQKFYKLMVVASDLYNATGCLNSTADVTIIVTDINDETPKFLQDHYMFTIPENVRASHVVGVITAVDGDLNSSQHIVYRIVSGDYGKFYIDSISGDLHVAGYLDRELTAVYKVNISAYDGAYENFTEVQVTVTDVNDNPPTFVFNNTFTEVYEISVPEDATQNQIIYNFTALDNDEKDNNNSDIKYSLTEDSGTFKIDALGSLTLIKQLDREKNDTYIIKVVAMDHGNPPMSGSVIVRIIILDVNDNSPVFCSSEWEKTCANNITYMNVSIVEKLPVTSIIALLHAKDPDFDSNGTISYILAPQQTTISKYFSVEPNTGIVRIKDTIVINTLVEQFNYSYHSNGIQLNLTITAKDGGPNGGRNSSLLFVVYVEPINDNSPVFDLNFYRFRIPENSPTGAFIGTCSARIANETYSHISYSFIDENQHEFRIDSNTGSLRSNDSALDRETRSTYTFAVKVRDGRIPERTAFAVVEVSLDDVNDNSPTFYNNKVVIQLSENTPIKGTQYLNGLNVSAFDRDSGENGTVTYHLSDNYDNLFYVTQNGTLFVNGTFDFETQANYSFDVIAVDGGNRSSKLNVTVNVLDLNDNAPQFKDKIHIVNVTRNQHSEQIFCVFAADIDSTCNGKVVYKLMNTDDGPFAIDPFGGNVSLLHPLNYEDKNMFLLVIEAADQGWPTLSSSKTVTVNVNDILSFGSTLYEVSVNWSASKHEQILHLQTSVKDVNFTLDGDDQHYFAIDNMGNILIANLLDRKKDKLTFRVTAHDKQNSSTTCTVIVHIIGHELMFQQRSIDVKIPENVNQSSMLIDLNTTAEMQGESVMYQIVKIWPDTNDTDLFNVSIDGKVFCNKALDREAHDYFELYISAYSMSSSRQKRDTGIDDSTFTIKLVVKVEDLNDNLPTFPSNQRKRFGIPRLTRAGYVVTKLRASDIDTTGSIYYKVKTTSKYFDVETNSGDIIILEDLMDLGEHELEIIAYNNDGDVKNVPSLTMQIFVFPSVDRLKFTANISVLEFEKIRDSFIRNMSDILDVVVEFESANYHQVPLPKTYFYNIDTNRTDLYVHAIDNTTGKIIPRQEILGKINGAATQLKQVFGLMVDIRKEDHSDPSEFTAASIALICFSIFTFFGSAAALLVLHNSWHRYGNEGGDHEDNFNEKLMERSSIRSGLSGKLSPAASSKPVKTTEQNTSSGEQPVVHILSEWEENKAADTSVHRSESFKSSSSDSPAVTTADSGIYDVSMPVTSSPYQFRHNRTTDHYDDARTITVSVQQNHVDHAGDKKIDDNNLYLPTRKDVINIKLLDRVHDDLEMKCTGLDQVDKNTENALELDVNVTDSDIESTSV